MQEQDLGKTVAGQEGMTETLLDREIGGELDAKAQELLEDKEADARMRTNTGPCGKLIVIL